MNYDAVVAWLMQSDWLFFAMWIAALVAAFAVAFPEPAAVVSRKLRGTHSRAL